MLFPHPPTPDNLSAMGTEAQHGPLKQAGSAAGSRLPRLRSPQMQVKPRCVRGASEYGRQFEALAPKLLWLRQRKTRLYQKRSSAGHAIGVHFTDSFYLSHITNVS
jgi:hypothetical protein